MNFENNLIMKVYKDNIIANEEDIVNLYLLGMSFIDEVYWQHNV